MKYKVNLEGHTFDVDISLWSGKEIVSYDGKIVSERRNLNVFSPVHSFTVPEAGEEVVYEVQILSGVFSHGYAIRRNGIIKAHRP